MTFFEIFAGIIFGYITNRVSETDQAEREKTARAALEKKESLEGALTSLRSLPEEVGRACISVARAMGHFPALQNDKPLRDLLSDPLFQADFTHWLMIGDIEEAAELRNKLVTEMTHALAEGGAETEHVAFVREHYFDAVERAIFAHPVLAAWRHQRSLDYLRQQVATIRSLAEQAAGKYTEEKQQSALEHYSETALKAWDIIDLSNLPEGDVAITTQAPLLRQLYVPIRVNVESSRGEDGEIVKLDALESRREKSRRRDAGRLSNDEAKSTTAIDKNRHPVGARLGEALRLVVLGDPGGGKTTLLRWMATAYLLRRKNDPAYPHLPDTATLPNREWLPILIRCRDLGEQDLCRSFRDFLSQHFRKSILADDKADVMYAVVLDAIARGKALLLVDGLDEITSPRTRALFCQELERVSVRYPDLPILVTSRIVGYRDMPFRMGAGFEHTVISPLVPEEKNHFAERWITVTEAHKPEDERTRRIKQLTDAIHSSDRIERLTGNPLLLTTMALVERKVGRLPNRRIDLYREAVPVLLNWNPLIYAQIDEREAVPQLEYLAYAMCSRGVQRLPKSEVLDLLERVRVDYPNIRDIKRRTAEQFLTDLEARSSILIQAGGIWNKGEAEAVYEFRHLTIQEYLAARALVDGRYPDRQKGRSLAEQIAPLAGQLDHNQFHRESEVTEAWRETIRLCIAAAGDDDVDDAILAVLEPLPSEKAEEIARPRSVLATLCLADEPNVSEAAADAVFAALMKQLRDVDSLGEGRSTLAVAVMAHVLGPWAERLTKHFLNEFLLGVTSRQESAGSLLGTFEYARLLKTPEIRAQWLQQAENRLPSSDQRDAVCIALTVMQASFVQPHSATPKLVNALCAFLNQTSAVAFAGVWALGWLAGGHLNMNRPSPDWVNSPAIASRCADLHRRSDPNDMPTRYWCALLLGRALDSRAISLTEELIAQRSQAGNSQEFRILGHLQKHGLTLNWQKYLKDEDADHRINAMLNLAILRDNVERVLLSENFDPDQNWIDPAAIITEARIQEAAKHLNLTAEEVRSKYEALEDHFCLTLEWKSPQLSFSLATESVKTESII